MAEVDFERRLEVAAPFIQQANAMANGLPRLLGDIGLWNVMAASVDDDTHLLIAMRAGLSGEAHGDHTTDAKKYVIPNRGFYQHIDTLINAGLWTPDENILYTHPVGIADEGPIGLSIPSLGKEKATLAEGEKSADTLIVAGATFDGLFSRVGVTTELLDAGSEATNLVVLTGPRATEPREGTSERYKDYDSSGSERPITEVFPTEYDSAKAIIEKTFGVEKSGISHDSTKEGHEYRGGEKGTYYQTTYNGRLLQIFVRNGMPVIEKEALNRAKNVANPRVPVTLTEYIQDYDITQGRWSYISSYPHRNRIAIEGIKTVHALGMLGDITIHPQGKMSAPDKVTAGLHMGEVYPIMQNTRELVKALGLPASLLVSTTEAVKRYIQTGH